MLDFRVATFLCVCKHMSFTRAAEELNLTQPAVSQHIRCLEEYYQVRLFSYRKKVLSLTEQGRYLKRVMETLQYDALRIQETVGRIESPRHMRLGATMSIGEYYLPKGLSSFMEAHPALNLSVTVANTEELLALLDSGAVDIVLCEGYFNKGEYAHQLIRRERMCVLCGADYDASGITELRDLFRHPVLMREAGSGTREVFENFLREQGYSLKNFPRLCDFTSPHLIVHMLLVGQGISVLYHAVGAAYLAEGRLVELQLPDFQVFHEFNAIWKKNSLFDETLRQMTQELIRYCDDGYSRPPEYP